MSFLCNFRTFTRKREGDKGLTVEAKQDLYKKFITLARNWDKGIGYENVKAAGFNTSGQFENVFKKYTKKPDFDMNEFPVNYKDYRKV